MSSESNVCVVIANYNYGRFIKDAIDSVFNQTHKCGMVVINAGSTDNSWDIIKEYFIGCEENIQNGITFMLKNEGTPQLAINIPDQVGPSAARNIGIFNMKDYAHYFQILDADDYMYPTKVEKLLKKAKSDSRIGVVYADYDILNVETGNTITEYKEPFSASRLLNECIVHSGSLINTKALLSVQDQFGLYDEEMRTAEDYDLWMRIAKKWLICHVPEPLTLVRVHRDNSTFTVNNEVWNRNWLRIRQKHGLMNA